MEIEVVGLTIAISLPTSSINPMKINEQVLKDHGIIDKDNKLDKSLYRVGSMGSSLKFVNKSEDEIQVQSTEIYLESLDATRLELIFNMLKNVFSDVLVKDIDFRFEIHVIEQNLPKVLFSNYVRSGDLKLKGILFSDKKLKYTVFSCGKNVVHVRLANEKKINKEFSDFNFAEDTELEGMKISFNNFITNEMKLTGSLNLQK